MILQRLSKLLFFVLSLALTLPAIPLPMLTAEAATQPYYITVDVTNQIVTIYNSDDDSIHRQMLCSTGKNGSTPIGTYTMPVPSRESERQEWYYSRTYYDYAKYATRVRGSILFHSIPFAKAEDATIEKQEALAFGKIASHGCIRLLISDAKYIADNCLPGTKVQTYKSNQPNEELRTLLYYTTYSEDSGLSYEEFLGMSEIPNVLCRGSSGSEVQDLQSRLCALGYYNGEINGEYLSETINAVKSVQRDLEMTQNGVTTARLREIIFSPDAPTSANVELICGSNGPAVRNLQVNLQTLGMYNGKLDSIYDTDVEEAVRIFQQAYGYYADGIATAAVQQAIEYEIAQMRAMFGDLSNLEIEVTSEDAQIAHVDSVSSLNFRAKASSASTIKDNILDGALIIVLDISGTWAKIQYEGEIGYVKKAFLDISNQANFQISYSKAGQSQVYTIGRPVEDFANNVLLPAIAFENYQIFQKYCVEDQGKVIQVTDTAFETPSTTTEASYDYANVTTGSDNFKLNLRANPSATGDILATLDNGTSVKVLLKSAEWSYVSYDSLNGYLLNDYLEFWTGTESALEDVLEDAPLLTDEPSENTNLSLSATVVASGGLADVYDQPDSASIKTRFLANNTEVMVIGFSGEWCLIDYQGATGYILSSNLNIDM